MRKRFGTVSLAFLFAAQGLAHEKAMEQSGDCRSAPACGRRFFRSRSFNQRESCLGQDEKFGRSPIVDFQIAATVLMHEVKTQDKQWRDKRVKYGLLPGGSETTTAALLHSRKRTPA